MRVHPTSPQIAAAFDSVKDSPAFAESAALVAAGGAPVEMLRAMSLRPELLQGFAALSTAIYPGGVVERSVKELIILEVSRRNACQFCLESHLAIVRSLGISQLPLQMLDAPGSMSARERLAVQYARAAVADSNRIPEELFAQLRAAFTEPEIVEVTAVIGLISMLNLFNNCLQNRYGGEYGAGSADPAHGGGGTRP